MLSRYSAGMMVARGLEVAVTLVADVPGRGDGMTRTSGVGQGNAELMLHGDDGDAMRTSGAG